MSKLAFTDFAPFEAFDQDVLAEIVREGEREMDARLQTANAADQRALTVAGFQLTAVIALTGGVYALLATSPPSIYLASVLIFEALALGGRSIQSLGLCPAEEVLLSRK